MLSKGRALTPHRRGQRIVYSERHFRSIHRRTSVALLNNLWTANRELLVKDVERKQTYAEDSGVGR